MPSSPADIGATNTLSIPPTSAVSYVSPDLTILIQPGGDSTLVYLGSSVGGGTTPPGESFNWSFLGYNEITPVTTGIQQTTTGPDATFVVPATATTAVFELTNPFVPGIPPIDVAIARTPGGPTLMFHQNINASAPVGSPANTIAQGVSLSFVDPLVSNGTVLWT